MSAQSVAERKRAERTRMRAEGYVLRQFWVHKKDWDRVQKYLLAINKRRYVQGDLRKRIAPKPGADHAG